MVLRWASEQDWAVQRCGYHFSPFTRNDLVEYTVKGTRGDGLPFEARVWSTGFIRRKVWTDDWV
jgi:hypothetical protein